MVHNPDIRQLEIFFHGWNLAILLTTVTFCCYIIEYKGKNITYAAALMTRLSNAFSQHPEFWEPKVCLYDINGLLF